MAHHHWLPLHHGLLRLSVSYLLLGLRIGLGLGLGNCISDWLPAGDNCKLHGLRLCTGCRNPVRVSLLFIFSAAALVNAVTK